MSVEELPLTGSVPTRAERERAQSVEHRVETALREAAQLFAWARRHSDDGLLTNELIGQASKIVNSEHVYVVRVEPCECGSNGSVGVVEWRIDEALRDAAMDVLIANVVQPGDELLTYRLRLPARLRELRDDSVTEWVYDLVPEDSGVDELVSHRYGSCPQCGSGPRMLSDEDALDVLAEMIEDDDYGRHALAKVIRETGRSVKFTDGEVEPPESMEPEGWVRELTEEEWIDSLMEE